MIDNPSLIGGLSPKLFLDIIDICSNLPDVQVEVRKNHDDNLWWPQYVTDWRLRMIIAGWSTRISYNMIGTYKRIVSDVFSIGYENLITMPDQELRSLIGPLGLFDTRKKYLNSMVTFLEKFDNKDEPLLIKENNELIKLIAENVNGASYKVAQCAVLYAKGYHCGVFPVDSGMKDLVGPCIGLDLPSGTIANEAMRLFFENTINKVSTELRQIVNKNGYSNLAIPNSGAPVWWAHLVLIYFKRLYCNKKKYLVCPLRMNSKTRTCTGAMCNKDSPQKGGFQRIILEGPDKSGKSTLAESLRCLGYSVMHSPYNPNHENIYKYYQNLIIQPTSPVVFDRMFISEMTYGETFRGSSRLTEEDYINLLKQLSDNGYILFYLRDDLQRLRERLLADSDNHDFILAKLEDLILSYDEHIKQAAQFITVYTVSPAQQDKKYIINYIRRVINES